MSSGGKPFFNSLTWFFCLCFGIGSGSIGPFGDGAAAAACVWREGAELAAGAVGGVDAGEQAGADEVGFRTLSAGDASFSSMSLSPTLAACACGLSAKVVELANRDVNESCFMTRYLLL